VKRTARPYITLFAEVYISETLLFRDEEDKDQYLYLLAVNANKYKCSVYAYCLMDNHLHIHLDPKGYDISSFMHSLNTSYVIYYNKKYDRHGHLFQERFHSEIVDSDRYNLALSAYIHKNPKDIPGYEGKEEEYKYSSYGIYLGIRKDIYRLVDVGFIRSLFGIKNKRRFVCRYKEFVSRCIEDCCIDQQIPNEMNDFTEIESSSSRRVITRERVPNKVIDYIASKLGSNNPLHNTSDSERRTASNDFRAFTAYVLRVICGLRYRQICEYILDLTISKCSRLCNKGFELLEQGEIIYSDIFNSIIFSDLH
jgi:putative transposase